MPRTETQIRKDLHAAYALDRTLKLGTAEYKANRQVIGACLAELAEAVPLPPLVFTTAAYEQWPDSFEQMATPASSRSASPDQMFESSQQEAA